MWTMAAAIFLGCKWLTFCIAKQRLGTVCPSRAAAYLLAWPGMDAARFVGSKQTPPFATEQFLKTAASALARMLVGGFFLFALARHAAEPLIAGWLGMIGVILLLHFGLFDVLSAVWRKLGVDAPPIMNAPLRSRSVAEFWGRRWNAAFNQLASALIFRPVARRTNAAVATLCAFGISGLVHELVISLPAGAGYGLPTAYFLLQGTALLVERRLGSSRPFTILVVAAPAFWLFHPPFVGQVILPFMKAIGAL
jgi:alginate O-acetyltransferase complex protein AlgI